MSKPYAIPCQSCHIHADICILELVLSYFFFDILCSIYPSQEQEAMGQQIPISNNTGSLPNLTVLDFPSPLTTPLDTEDGSGGSYGGNSSPVSLSPTSPHHMSGMPPPQSQQSPAQRRRNIQPVPSPLVLNNATQMHSLPLSPPVSIYFCLCQCYCEY